MGPQPKCLSLNEKLFPEELKNAGYSTHLIGKWHLGGAAWECLPTRRGFDSFYGFLQGAQSYHNRTSLFYGMDEIPGIETWAIGYDFWRNESVELNGRNTYSTYLYSDEAEKIISSKNNESSPFFMYLSFQSVHYPMEVPQTYLDMYSSDIKEPRRLGSS